MSIKTTLLHIAFALLTGLVMTLAAGARPWTNTARDARAESPPEQPGPLTQDEPAEAVTPAAPQVSLSGFEHEWQTWNNCGPATVSMNLSYYGHAGGQVEAAQFLKPNPDDKNVSPHELVAYAHSAGYDGLVGYGGDVELLKQFLTNGYPVLVEIWVEPEDVGGLGHYRLLTGYSQSENKFWAHDSLHGPDISVPMDEFDRSWQVFNRTYVLVFPPQSAAEVGAILGARVEPTAMHRAALRAAQEETEVDPDDAFAWFNAGTNYTRLDEPALAASAFDQAHRLGLPYRMLWYQFEVFEAYLALGRYQDVINLATVTLEATGGLEELYYYRGLALRALGQSPAAARDFRAALEYNPNYDPARQATGEP
jgi:tetratricopeptide (TPR) repeat protein